MDERVDMSDSNAVLLVENECGVRTLRMNRPDVLNAFDHDLLGAMVKEAKLAARDDTVRCLVIAANGRAFCSGQDLESVKDSMNEPGGMELGQHIRKLYNPLILSLRTMEKPVIASVNGVAAGAGCSLAIACDLRIAATSASFIEVFINVGLVPDSGSTFTLPRLIGMGRAMEMAFTGRKVRSDEALNIGLVNQVVPDEELSVVTRALAGRLATMPTKGIGLTKRAFNRGWTVDLADQLEYEAALQTTAGQSHDHKEGVQAFLEKRKPEFKGC